MKIKIILKIKKFIKFMKKLKINRNFIIILRKRLLKIIIIFQFF